MQVHFVDRLRAAVVPVPVPGAEARAGLRPGGTGRDRLGDMAAGARGEEPVQGWRLRPQATPRAADTFGACDTEDGGE